MSSRAIQAVAVILGIVAVILIVFVWRLSRSFAENAANTAPPVAAPVQQAPVVPQYLVVVATIPLAANVPIKKDDVVLAPVTVQPTEYFANVDDVVGRTPLVDLDKGQPVTPRFFKDSNLLARGIPPGSRALSLKVDDVVGVGGFIRPGDMVDLLVYIKSATDTPTGDKAKKEDLATQARVLLKDVVVLVYEDHLVEPPKGIEEKDKTKAVQQRRERTAVVAVPEAQVTRVLLGASLGELRLSLHGVQETDAQTAAVGGSAGDVPGTSLPLSKEARDKARAGKNEPIDEVITAAELAKVKPVVAPASRSVKAAPPPRVEVYRGSKVQQVFP